MSRLLKMLEQFDDNVTVGQVISKLKQDEISAKEKETEKINKVKEDFKNVYLKRIYDCDLFGETLEVYHIEEIIAHTICTDYNLVYYIKGSKIMFSHQDIIYRKLGEDTTDTFSEEELRGMTKIAVYDYKKYKAKYSQLANELKNLIRL